MIPWILAARPKTLPAAIVPVWVGCLLVWDKLESLDWILATCTLFGALFIQIATNFFNDAIDARKGADTEQRLGPIRATASGRLSSRAVMTSGCICLLLAAMCGAVLWQAAGWPILLIGLVSFFFAYGYTGGPLPLAYLGLGEIFVIIFFGFVAVMGTVYVQTGEWLSEAMLAGAQVGLLSAVLISINNLRDRDEDKLSHKRTLAVKLGLAGGRQLIVWEVVLAGMLAQMWTSFDQPFWILTGLPMCTLGIFIVGKILTVKPSVYYNKLLALSALMLVSYACVLTVLVIS